MKPTYLFPSLATTTARAFAVSCAALIASAAMISCRYTGTHRSWSADPIVGSTPQMPVLGAPVPLDQMMTSAQCASCDPDAAPAGRSDAASRWTH